MFQAISILSNVRGRIVNMCVNCSQTIWNLPGHGDDGGNCVVHGCLLSSLLVEHSQNSIYGYSKSLSSNIYGSPNWETYKAHGSKSIYELKRLVLKIDFDNNRSMGMQKCNKKNFICSM